MNLEHVLRSLQWGLHAMFAFLLIFGVTNSAVDGTLSPLVLGLSLALAALYAAWRWRGTLWIALVTFIWAGLMFHAQDFMWLEFPLVFLYLRYLPRSVRVPAVGILWAVAAFFPAWRYPQSWTLAHIVGPAIGTIFAIAMYFSYVALRREAENYRDLATQLRATQDELARSENLAGRLAERERLSREIHDTVAQGLSSIVLMSRAAKGAADPSTHLATIHDVAQESLGQARRFVSELSAPPSLPQALESLIQSHRSQAAAVGENTAFELVLTGDTAATLPPEISGALERAAREGLANAAKHAHASRVVVTLGVFANRVTLDVVDDGVGLSKNAPSEGSYGLRGLRERISNAGGQLSIESKELPAARQPGTTLTVVFNLEAR